MKKLITTQNNEDGEIIISGRELHEFLEVKTAYKDWFPRMVSSGFVEGTDFTAIAQKRATVQGNLTTFIDHHIKLDMAKEIAMIQRTEKGKQARQYFLHLEKMWNSPDVVIKRAMDFQQKKIFVLETQILGDKPYTNLGKVIGMSDAAINVGSFAKIIYNKHGINIGRNKLMKWLRCNGYLIETGREKNLPKQQFIEQGFFKVIPAIVKRTEGDIQVGTTLITGKGQVKLTEVLLKEFSKEVDSIN